MDGMDAEEKMSKSAVVSAGVFSLALCSKCWSKNAMLRSKSGWGSGKGMWAGRMLECVYRRRFVVGCGNGSSSSSSKS